MGDNIRRLLEGALSQKYKRPITATARHDARLIAGLRVRVGDDVYETSVAAQLANLSTV